MSRSLLAVVAVALPLFCLDARAAEPLKSGLQAGETITTIFEPLNVNGPQAGEQHCLICENGLSPVAMIFAREVSEPLVTLIKQLDDATVKHREQQMGCFVVFLGEQEKLESKLKAVAQQQKLKHVVLSIDAPAGPEGFNVSPAADVTVVLYREHGVLANHAFAKGQLTNQAAAAVLADLPKILKK